MKRASDVRLDSLLVSETYDAFRQLMGLASNAKAHEDAIDESGLVIAGDSVETTIIDAGMTSDPASTGYYATKYRVRWMGPNAAWGKWEYDDDDDGAGNDFDQVDTIE